MTQPSATCLIRREPSDADMSRIISAAQRAVKEIADADGVLGHEEISRLYVRRIL